MMSKYFILSGLVFSMFSCAENEKASLEPKIIFKHELIDLDGVKAIKIDESTYSFRLIEGDYIDY